MMESQPNLPPFVCAACGQRFHRTEEVVLLRPRYALPEEASIHFLHEACADAFQASLEGRWIRFRVPSATASWFLPVARVRRRAASHATASPQAGPALSIWDALNTTLSSVILQFDTALVHFRQALEQSAGGMDSDDHRDMLHLYARMESTARQLQDTVETMERLRARKEPQVHLDMPWTPYVMPRIGRR